MIFTWIIVLALEFSIGLIYFTISDPVHTLLIELVGFGAPSATVDFIMLCFNLGFVVLAVGLLVYAILRSVRVEHDTYSSY